MQQAYDYIAEASDLADVLSNCTDQIFNLETQFKSWTINDIVGHLYMFDLAALKALECPKIFQKFFAPIANGMDNGLSLRECQYRFLGSLTHRALFKRWKKISHTLGQAYSNADPKQRVKWIGPEMSAMSSITARQMEIWAHGQEIYDALGIIRPAKDRIRNICHLGVATFGWSFHNRGLIAPQKQPYVRLKSPSGTVWEWNNPEAESWVVGDALAFAQVVTQVRSIDDITLKVKGPAAQKWMSIAQCFAGAPENPPKKGARFVQN